MKIKIRIHPNSSQEKVIKISEEEYEVWLNQPPFEGKANKSLEKLLKKYFGVGVKIIKGLKSKIKIVKLYN